MIKLYRDSTFRKRINAYLFGKPNQNNPNAVAKALRNMGYDEITQMEKELNLKPDYISGTSIGAIIGAMYASGKSGVEIELMFKNLKLNSEIFHSNNPSLEIFNKSLISLSRFNNSCLSTYCLF